jgi:peptide/nickel transport system ATP-binding protein
VLVCDEITSSLDVSVQAMILRLLDRLRTDEQGLSLLFVTHNLGLVRSVADRVLVMHRGEVVEQAETERLFTDPQQDYTRRLLADTPSLLDPTPSERRALATGQ